MKNLFKVILAAMLVTLAGCAAGPATQSAGEEAAANSKANWYSNIVDGAYVEKHAKLPRLPDVMVIDARPTKRRYDPGHIPGAVSMPNSQFDKMADMLPKDKSTQLIFYCGGTKCMLSHKSAKKAEKLGYSNIKVYAAGFPDWIKRGNLKAVSIAQVKKLVDTQAPVVIIDSRPKKRKYDKGHIPGAISIPDSQFNKLTDKLPADKSTPLYFYCGGYKCKLSPDSAKKAVKLGYKKVHVVPAGYPAWKKAYGEAKAPVIKAGKEDGSISIASFQEIMKSNPASMMVVDVRDPEEYASGTIKGSVNIPINALEKEMEGLPKKKAIVFVCGTAGRAGEAYDMVQMFMPDLKTYFLNAEVTFRKDGSYDLKEIN